MTVVVFLAAFACTCLCSSKTVQAKTYKVKSAADWNNIAKKSGGTFKITKNIKLTKTSQYLTISKNKKYTIDLNGHEVKTSYGGTAVRKSPLTIQAGTVVLKDSSKKKTGYLYSSELVTVEVGGKASFYVTSATIMNDFADFRSGTATAIYLKDHSKCYLQGRSLIGSVNNGVWMYDQSKLDMTGKPSIIAGFLDTDIQFTHYGSGIFVQHSGCTLSLKGGAVSTYANPDVTLSSATGSYNYLTSGSYPVYDKSGKVLKKPAGYVFVDANTDNVPITNEIQNMLPGMYDAFKAITGQTGASRLATSVADSDGCYTVFIFPDPTIVKKIQKLTVKKKTLKVSASKLKKKSQTVSAKKVTKGTKAKTAVTYKLLKASKAKRYFKVAKTGKITIKKKLKKGTYKLIIKATAASSPFYKSASKNFVVTVRVR